jgi:hypothetical protein
MQTDLIEHMVVNGTREGKAACGRRPRKSIHQLASHFRDNSGRLANECSRSKNMCFPARSNTSNFNARTDFPDMGTIGVHKMSAVAHNARITALRAPVALGSAPVLRPDGPIGLPAAPKQCYGKMFLADLRGSLDDLKLDGIWGEALAKAVVAPAQLPPTIRPTRTTRQPVTMHTATEKQLGRMNKPHLIAHLQQFGCDTDGKKHELVARVLAQRQSTPGSTSAGVDGSSSSGGER